MADNALRTQNGGGGGFGREKGGKKEIKKWRIKKKPLEARLTRKQETEKKNKRRNKQRKKPSVGSFSVLEMLMQRGATFLFVYCDDNF